MKFTPKSTRSQSVATRSKKEHAEPVVSFDYDSVEEEVGSVISDPAAGKPLINNGESRSAEAAAEAACGVCGADAPSVAAAAETAFRNLIATLGPQEATRPVLAKTPARAAKAFLELTQGLSMDPLDAVGEGIFDSDSSGLVEVSDIQFHSLCEHHLLPFSGKARVAYLPDGKILGLSKFARLIDVFARRPQVQERLTEQVAEFLERLLKPRAVVVSMQARHACMTVRGALQPNAVTRTLVFRGPLKDDPSVLRLLGASECSRL